jgi:hypothetical protein
VKISYQCKLNYVGREPGDTCCWDTKRYPSRFEPKEEQPPHSSATSAERVLRPDVLYFALCMERELRKHDKERGYRGWQGYIDEEERGYLIRRLMEEIQEIVQEIGYNNNNPEKEPPHVGNFAMMLQTAHLAVSDIEKGIEQLKDELRQQQEKERER